MASEENHPQLGVQNPPYPHTSAQLLRSSGEDLTPDWFRMLTLAFPSLGSLPGSATAFFLDEDRVIIGILISLLNILGVLQLCGFKIFYCH